MIPGDPAQTGAAPATARELHDLAAEALRIAGPPTWPSVDAPDAADVLAFLDADEAGGEPVWALTSEGGDEGDYIAIDPTMACTLIRTHLEGWLMERGWQVQVRLTRGRRQWRLVDCLSSADGGGDRLDDEYPQGEDALRVICASIVVVAQA